MKKNKKYIFWSLVVVVLVIAVGFVKSDTTKAYFEQYAAYIDYTYNVIGNNNCEQGALNPSLNIVTDHSEAVRFGNAARWFNNRFFNACYYNTTGQDLFVPSRTQAEKDSFNTHLPSGVVRANGQW